MDCLEDGEIPDSDEEPGAEVYADCIFSLLSISASYENCTERKTS